MRRWRTGAIVTFDPYGTKVPEGEYRVAFIGLEEGVAFGSPRWFGHFEIVQEGTFHGLLLLRVWNKPQGRFLARSHNLSLDYMNLIGKRPPARSLKPDVFLKNCELLADVVTVKHQIKGRKRVLLPEDCHYSKIDRLIKITAGCPPCLVSRGRR